MNQVVIGKAIWGLSEQRKSQRIKNSWWKQGVVFIAHYLYSLLIRIPFPVAQSRLAASRSFCNALEQFESTDSSITSSKVIPMNLCSTHLLTFHRQIKY